MIDITERNTKCFAELGGSCTALITKGCDGCRFYKPVNCSDWVRLNKDGNAYLFEPEEYEKERKNI